MPKTNANMIPTFLAANWFVDSSWDLFAAVTGTSKTGRATRKKWQKLGQVASVRSTRKGRVGGHTDVSLVFITTTKTSHGDYYALQSDLFMRSRVKSAALLNALGCQGETPPKGPAFARKFVCFFDWCVTLVISIG